MGASVFFLDNLNKNISPQKWRPYWAKFFCPKCLYFWAVCYKILSILC